MLTKAKKFKGKKAYFYIYESHEPDSWEPDDWEQFKKSNGEKLGRIFGEGLIKDVKNNIIIYQYVTHYHDYIDINEANMLLVRIDEINKNKPIKSQKSVKQRITIGLPLTKDECDQISSIDGRQRINIAFQQILTEGGLLDARKGAQIVFLLSRATPRDAYRLTLETLLNLHSNHCGKASFVRNINETLTSVRMRWDCSEGRMIFIGPDSVPTIDYDYLEQGILSSEYEGLEPKLTSLQGLDSWHRVR